MWCACIIALWLLLLTFFIDVAAVRFGLSVICANRCGAVGAIADIRRWLTVRFGSMCWEAECSSSHSNALPVCSTSSHVASPSTSKPDQSSMTSWLISLVRCILTAEHHNGGYAMISFNFVRMYVWTHVGIKVHLSPPSVAPQVRTMVSGSEHTLVHTSIICRSRRLTRWRDFYRPDQSKLRLENLSFKMESQ